MATQHINASTTFNYADLAKRMLFGALLGFIAISFFVFGVDDAKPEWGKYWMIRPLIVEPIAGAAAMALTYFISLMIKQKALAIVLSVIVVLIALWLGSVVGLDGTMWN